MATNSDNNSTERYPNDNVTPCYTEDQMFELIDSKLPTQQRFEITGKRIRETVKSLFKSLLPGEEKSQTFEFKIIRAKYIADQDAFSIDFSNIYNERAQATGQEWAMADIINTINNKKYLKVIPKQLQDNQGTNFYFNNWYYYNDMNNIIQYFNERNVIGVDYDYSHYNYILRFENNSDIQLSNGTDVLLIYSDVELDFINIEDENLNYITLSLNIENDTDNIILKPLYYYDFRTADNFLSSLVFTHIKPDNEISNGKKLRVITERQKIVYDKHVQQYMFTTINGVSACLVAKESIEESKIIDSKITDILGYTFTINSYDNDNYIVYNSTPNRQAFVYSIKTPSGASYVKSVVKYYEPRICFTQPTDYNYKTIITAQQTIYMGLNETIDSDYTINGVYFFTASNPQNIYSHRGATESLVELTMWNKKWFISGVNY